MNGCVGIGEISGDLIRIHFCLFNGYKGNEGNVIGGAWWGEVFWGHLIIFWGTYKDI